MKTEIKKAMVFAAGLGTRLKPFTELHPKALFPVNGKTLLERNIEYLKKYGIDEVVINVHHFADQIIDYVSNKNCWGIKIIFSDERNELMDTGGGLMKAGSFFEGTENIIVYNADILTNMPLDKMIEYHLNKRPLATLAVSERESSRFFLFDDEERLCGWKNVVTCQERKSIIKSEYCSRAFNGIHIVNKDLLKTKELVEKFSITDWYLDICADYKILGFNDKNSVFIDVGKNASIPKAELLFP